MAISDTIQSMYDNVGEVYDTITNVSLPEHKNIENIPSTIRESYLEIMNNGIEVIWDNWEKVVGEGTSLTLNNTVEAPMKVLLKGNTYQEGTPTPDTPIPVNVVSGDNEVEVCGKNLIPFKNQDFNLGSTRFYCKNGTLYITGQATEISSLNQKFKDNFSFTLPPGTYYFDRHTCHRTTYLRKYDDTLLKQNAGSITLSETTKVYLGFYVSGVSGTFDNVELPIGLTIGNTTQPFEPYQSTTYPINLPEGMFLGSIGDYKDTFFKTVEGNPIYDSLDSATKQTLDSNEWYLEKKIGKVVLNGSEEWVIFNSSSSRVTFRTVINGIEKYTNGNTIPNIISNRFIPNSYNATWVIGNVSRTTSSGGQNFVLFVYEPNTTVEQFDAWLSSNNIIAYYVLATPTYTKIEGTLASQLEEVYRAKSKEGQTNISQVNQDLPFELSVTALESFE